MWSSLRLNGKNISEKQFFNDHSGDFSTLLVLADSGSSRRTDPLTCMKHYKNTGYLLAGLDPYPKMNPCILWQGLAPVQGTKVMQA
ncbi:hypothetical protein Y032_0020g224 [Ancylostoma ceylanicum]|uniref:Uncharacterized protein n=1 Tax=Ancylostoma ceylanicum TaxID=53326 RepID=A0A016V110_9BILA|nr:hypothetical protein Y032_0020g224 [Ancylostoma ceylanicum]